MQRRSLTDAEGSERVRAWVASLGITPSYTIGDPSGTSFRLQPHRDRQPSTLADNEVVDGIRDVASLFATARLLVSSETPRTGRATSSPSAAASRRSASCTSRSRTRRHGPALLAIKTILAIEERRAKLLGLDTRSSN